MRTKAQTRTYNQTYRARHHDQLLAKQRAYYEVNKERIKSSAKARRVANPTKNADACRAYYRRTRDARLASEAERYRTDAEVRARKAAYNRAYRAANSDRLKQADRERWQRNRAAVAVRQRTYYEKNRDRKLAGMKAWSKAHPEVKLVHFHNRRARLVGNGGSHTAQEWREKCALFANLCAYCGEAKPLIREHKVPICRGGTNDITNIVPACKTCNSRKGRKTAAEYLKGMPK